ncbi:MAG: intradiol ring-cleavage dioxygenase [Massilia sp.]|nr:intradiol ring-cleavage dioxygenase [Massilia sp.]
MDDHHHNLAADIETMLNMTANRRQSLRWLFATAALPLAGCGGGAAAATAATTTTTTPATPTTGSPSTTCAVIPEETGGPYPGDGTNNSVGGVANALILAGIVRSDIRASIAGATGVAAGIALTIKLQMVDVSKSCASLAGATVYLWHCDRDGQYSMYTSPITSENYLRGVQEADAAGLVTFTTIFPGCYAGRMPHVHFEVYPTLAKATVAANRIKTSQFGFPTATSSEAYATSGYSASVRNLAAISYATDNVFSDGTALQIASVTGSPAAGYVATLTVGVSV